MNDVTTSPAVVAIQDQIAALSREGRDIVIVDNDSYAEAGEFLKKIKAAQKQVDETRKGMTRPLDESKKKIMELFRPAEDRIAEIETTIKNALLKYQKLVSDRLQNELEEKRRKDAEEAEQKRKDAAFYGESDEDRDIEPPKAEEAPINVRPVVSGISTKTVWTFEYTNEKLVPREYCTPDDRKIRAALELGVREMAGVRIFEKQVISARR